VTLARRARAAPGTGISSAEAAHMLPRIRSARRPTTFDNFALNGFPVSVPQSESAMGHATAILGS
jgi:hypothetical protein